MVMKILYDFQIFNKQHYGGISRYFCELMDRFSRDPGIDFHLALRYSLNEYLQQQPQLNRFWTRRNDFFTDSLFFTDLQKKIQINALNHIFNNRRESIQRLRERDFDIFHPTYYDPYFLDYLGKTPYILTIYDMIHEQYPGDFDTSDPTSAGKKILAENAKEIIAISENTKTDIVKFLDIDPGKIQVIPLASSFNLENMARQNPVAIKRNFPGKYLLFIGNRFSYKNFTFLVEALFPVFKNNGDLHLICAGGGKFTGPEIKLIRKMDMTSRLHLFPADDATLLHLYRNASAFVFPSLYEGFGLPVLDAFSCGCPALLSNTGSLPEVGGNAALYFDPVDRVSLTAAIGQILSNDTLKEDLRSRGLNRAKLFSWEKTAAMTKKVYEAAIE